MSTVQDEVTGVRAEVELVLDVPPERLWDLVTDVGRIGRWSPECEHAAWLDGAAGPRPGHRFAGRNRFPGGLVTEVVCVVTEAERPRTFGWVVLDPDGDPGTPSTAWRYELRPGDRPYRTVVRHTVVHGPGYSGLRDAVESDPDPAGRIRRRDERLAELRANMAATLVAMAREAGR